MKDNIHHQDTKTPSYTKEFHAGFLGAPWCLGALVVDFDLGST
jgi:hypothetical protein